MAIAMFPGRKAFAQLLVVPLTLAISFGCDSAAQLRDPEVQTAEADPRNMPEVTCLADMDNDGWHGSLVNPKEIEEAGGCPEGTLEITPLFDTDERDCDDENNADYPGAEEFCDGRDNDCDGEIDEDNVCGDDDTDVPQEDDVVCVTDRDGDDYFVGNPVTRQGDCLAEEEEYDPRVHNPGDCNDSTTDGAQVNPGRTEVCNGVDDNCRDGIDEDDVCGVPQTCYLDQDGDQWGDPLVSQSFTGSCPSGWTSDNTDCDDSTSAIHPGATEVCDGEDNDCDLAVDEGDVCTTGIERTMEVCWSRTSSDPDRNLNNASDGTLWFTGEGPSGGVQNGSFTTVCKCGLGSPGEIAEGNVTFSSTDHRTTSSTPVRERVPTGWSVWWAASNNNGRLMLVGDFWVDYTCNSQPDGSPVAVTVFPSGGGAGARWTNPPAP